MIDTSNVPVFVLCGGLGTRLREETEHRPKPMVPVGGHPIVWHVMRWYSNFGFKRFVLCLGYKSEAMKSYFLNYASMNSDFTVNLKSNDVAVHSVDHDQDWEVTLAYTGELNMTGSRIAQAAQRYLGDAEHMAVTYGDGLTDVDLGAEFQAHCDHQRIGTVLGVNPPSRFGELKLDDQRVIEFEEKPEFSQNWINGGYFFFRRNFLSYLSSDADCVLEKKPLVELARDKELSIFKHEGFWACMDTQRDREQLEELWETSNAPWAPKS